MTLSVLLAGGGTTGHIAPLLALAECLRRRDPSTLIRTLGTAEGLESRLVPAAGYELVIVPRVPLPRRPSVDLLRLPGRVSTATAAAERAMAGVDVVVGFGGYVSVPAYLAARRLDVPFVVHEGNARAGVANRLGARWAAGVGVAFEGTGLRQATLVGMPLRSLITGLDRVGMRDTARVALGLDPNRRTLLVTGGSSGAQRLNLTFGASAQALADAGVQVLHASGRGKSVEVETDGTGYTVVEYLDRMDLAYAAADLVVCRAGAGTVCEISALGLPAAYVPLPIGNGEQRLNAQPVVEAGGALLVADAGCTPTWVSQVLIPLLLDDARLSAMGTAAAAFGVRDGDERLADLVEKCARHESVR